MMSVSSKRSSKRREEKRREEKKNKVRDEEEKKTRKRKKERCRRSQTHTVIRIFTVLDDPSKQFDWIAVSTVIPGESGGGNCGKEG